MNTKYDTFLLRNMIKIIYFILDKTQKEASILINESNVKSYVCKVTFIILRLLWSTKHGLTKR